MAQNASVESHAATVAFSDRLADAVDRKRSQLFVGLDPRVDLLPVELRGEALATRRRTPSRASAAGSSTRSRRTSSRVKPQLAFFEALGADGIRAFEDVCAYARTAGLLVSPTRSAATSARPARAYAAAYLEPRDARRSPTR